MTKSKVLITAVDGFTGYSIVKHILETPALKDGLEGIYAQAEQQVKCQHLKNQGIQVEEMDTLSPPDKMIEIMKRANIVVVIPSALPKKTKRASNLLEACKSAGVKKVILISIAGCELASEDKHESLYEFQKIEYSAKQMGFDLVILRANFYAENLLLYKAQLKEGKLPLPIGEGKMAPVCLKDVADVVGTFLMNEEKFKECPGKVYTLTGVEPLSGKQMAEHFSTCLGKKIEFQDISNEEAKKILSGVKEIDESEKMLLLSFYDLVKAGKADFCDPHGLEALAGHAPTSFEDFLKMYKSELTGKS